VSEQEITNGIVLRLFNVYGPNEYHKGRMASTVYHWYNQLCDTDQIKIFENSRYYRRDFVWVEDVARTVYHFLNNYKEGIYDLGAGISVDFESIANIVIEEYGQGNKEYIPMPEDLKSQYQLDTKADTNYLREAGVTVDDFLEPWEGIKEYFKYLKNKDRY
jgi:ADP-L-glycero-D-manno-heptose 6-epimerase